MHNMSQYNNFKYHSSCKKISFLGGGERAGATSLSIKTALELSQLDGKVLYISTGTQDENIFFEGAGEINRMHFSYKKINDLLSGRKSFYDFIFRTRKIDFFFIDKTDFNENVLFSSLSDVVKYHENEYDYIIYDTSGKIEKAELLFCKDFHYHWLILTPQRESITTCYSHLKNLNTMSKNFRGYLFINKYKSEDQFLRIASNFQNTVENFLNIDVSILGGLPKFYMTDEKFETFFLPSVTNEINSHFVKILMRFAEEINGSLSLHQERMSSDVL